MKSSTFRLVILLLAVVALLGVFTSLGILGDDDKDPADSTDQTDTTTSSCSHDYKIEVVQHGTCTVDEITMYTCKKCGSQSVSYSDADGHRFADGVCEICDYSCSHSSVTVGEINEGMPCLRYLTCNVCGCSGARIVEHVAWDDVGENCNACGFGETSGDIWYD